MAITIDWANRIINVPQADMTLVQTTPFDIYELDVDAFRLALKDIEDGEGIPFPDTHRHNTTVTLGGVTLARTVEIINDYTVTFENGSYAVALVGANNNIADVVNLNNVQVRSSNSAGLVAGDIADGLLDAPDAIEAGLTPRNALRLAAAAAGGKISGAETTNPKIRSAVADDKDRIDATVDAAGNRTAITYDLSD